MKGADSMLTRQDFIIQEFKRKGNLPTDRKELKKTFKEFVKAYGYKITCTQAEKILNMYNGLADMSKYKSRRKRFYCTVLD